MNELGLGLHNAKHNEEALVVFEANLYLRRRLDASEARILTAQSNLALTYGRLGRHEEALRLKRDVYSGRLKLFGEENRETLIAANNYASSLNRLRRFEDVKSLMRKKIPVARRVLGESHILTLRMRWAHAHAIYADSGTLDDLREAVEALRTAVRIMGHGHRMTESIWWGLKRRLDDFREGVDMLAETEQTARRVLGSAHPVTAAIEVELRNARAKLYPRRDMLYRTLPAAYYRDALAALKKTPSRGAKK